ncbi:hypothetical protein [Phytoactinopolyspora halotolerans]|uniref:Uncharacterized protein n=1 Tax=Phytoactinopolyspora halotolerans TaxID=1981512 RepID=A0A6L9S9X2_9ACTN|nr:hypothetical protein [Phytoactinopolyspora halotolerans]NEE01823.1 hypothetical protein [Phytoactinopolyspora halotolerans]
MAVGRTARVWIIGTLVVSTIIAAAVVFVIMHLAGERSSVAGSRDLDDVAALDAYAEELGLVMIRNRRPDPAAYARRVDGPGPDVETLELSDPPDTVAPAVVLRIRQQRQERIGWISGQYEEYEISACYRWTFTGMEDYKPDRLEECPEVDVIELGPPPVVPELPDGFGDVLSESLTSLSDAERRVPETVVAAVRSAYTEAVDDALDEPGADPAGILSSDDVLAGDDWVETIDEVIGLAVGRGRSCVLARVTADDVAVWHPDRISLEPGEVGCSASSAAYKGDE